MVVVVVVVVNVVVVVVLVLCCFGLRHAHAMSPPNTCRKKLLGVQGRVGQQVTLTKKHCKDCAKPF